MPIQGYKQCSQHRATDESMCVHGLNEGPDVAGHGVLEDKTDEGDHRSAAVRDFLELHCRHFLRSVAKLGNEARRVEAVLAWYRVLLVDDTRADGLGNGHRESELSQDDVRELVLRNERV